MLLWDRSRRTRFRHCEMNEKSFRLTCWFTKIRILTDSGLRILLKIVLIYDVPFFLIIQGL